MASPATITAMTGDTCSTSPSTYAAYGVISASTVSSTGSVTRRRTGMTPAAITPPAAAPPAARTANCPAPCTSTRGTAGLAVPATARDTAIWNSTRLVASLNRLSACTSACTLGGSDRRRPSALTATGRVQQRRQHDQADGIRRYMDRREPRQQADDQPGDHQQGRGRDAKPASERRDHRAQHDQEQDGLYTVHATDLARSPLPDRCRPDFPARHRQLIRAAIRSAGAAGPPRRRWRPSRRPRRRPGTRTG